MTSRDYPNLVEVGRRSLMYRAAEGARLAIHAAIHDSAALAAARTTWERHAAWPATARLRAAGVVATIAAGGHLALLRFVPPQIAPGIPKAWWVLVAALGGGVALGARPLAGGWDESILGRAVRWRPKPIGSIRGLPRVTEGPLDQKRSAFSDPP